MLLTVTSGPELEAHTAGCTLEAPAPPVPSLPALAQDLDMTLGVTTRGERVGAGVHGGARYLLAAAGDVTAAHYEQLLEEQRCSSRSKPDRV